VESKVANAFDAAAVWVDSSVSNIATSLEAFGSKLKNELILMQNGLQKSANEIASVIQERGEADMDSFQEIASTLMQNVESTVSARLNEFGDSCADALTQSNDSFTSMPTKLGEELTQMEAEATKRTSQDFASISNDLSTVFSEYVRATESISEGFKNLIENTSITLTQHRDEVFEQVKKSAEMSNQYASRKFETIGLDLKTQLSSDTSNLFEKARVTYAAKNQEITDSMTKTTNIINEKTSVLKQDRNKALSLLGEHSDKAFKRWSTDQKDQMSSLNDRLHDAVLGITQKTESTIQTLDAIHDIADEIIKEPSKRTWYVSGKEEVCAHITDMADRAEDSVIISVIDPACLDYKKLGKVKQPKRKILMIPESEEPDPNLSVLEGWRIWETKTPMYLSLIDDREILVGGATATEDIIALISEDETYLRLYHDIIGPRLVRGRIT
jgi:hypothetical protein